MIKKLSALLAVVLLWSVPALADLEVKNNGTNAGQFRKVNLDSTSGLAIDNSGNITGTAGSPTFASLTVTGALNNAALTASQVVITDASKNLTSATTATYPAKKRCLLTEP
jgi:hypothetical protein